MFDRWCTSKTSTGTSGLLEGVGGFAEAPLHRVNLRSDLVSGSVTVGVQSVEGIYFIIGNDLAGTKVLADPKVVEKPRGMFPACADTRSMSKRTSEGEFSDIGHEINLEDTFMCQLDDDSVVRLWKVSLCEIMSQLLRIS